MTSDLCAQARDLLPAYSIGATNDEDTRFVELQLAACPELAQELEDYEAFADEMLRHVPQVAPPPRLLNTLLAAAATSPAPLSETPAPKAAPKKTPARPFVDRLPPRVGYGLAAVLLVVLFGSNLYWLAQTNRLRDDRTALYEEYRALENDLNSKNISFDAMRAPDTRWARLASPLLEVDTLPQATDPYAWIIWSRTRQEGVLMIQNFPTPASGKVYQLWGHHGDEDTSLTTFDVDTQGRALVILNDASWGYERFWITSEPTGGSPKPSGDPLVRVRLSS